MIHRYQIRPASVLLTAALICTSLVHAFSATLPSLDERAGPPKTLNTRWVFPQIDSQKDWQKHAEHIRQHILVSCGLWPMPPRTPLNPRLSDRLERDGYAVEKVALETYPGFYLAGNLYRPLGQGNGPFPAILNPHGHWANGRFEDTDTGSIAARCIQFARLGMIAFSYDMVGYGDTHQVGPHRQFATDPTHQLWNISLMGLQTWNSLRALDFLASLPDVDGNRLACTGASGGGTQTFILGAIDDRLAAQAPNVMVSCSMQGGCLCENAPGLRLDFSNMEIAAAAAPRPQILVAASGDWTKETMSVEGPSLESVYQLFGVPDHLRYQRFDFPHNYNQASREAVYRWFARWLLDVPNPDSIEEAAYHKEPNEALQVWSEGRAPAGALNADQLIAFLMHQSQQQLDALRPTNANALAEFRAIMEPAWIHTLALGPMDITVLREKTASRYVNDVLVDTWAVGRAGTGMRLPVLVMHPREPKGRRTTILTHPDGKRAYQDAAGHPVGLAALLLQKGVTVIVADVFLTGDLADAAAASERQHLANLFTTYNRTDLQERVRDLVTLCDFARQEMPAQPVTLCGQAQAGLWALLASPAADAIAAEAQAWPGLDDQAWLARDLFVPGMRKLGGVDTATALAAPRPLLIHHSGAPTVGNFTRAAYQAAGQADQLVWDTQERSDETLARWIATQE